MAQYRLVHSLFMSESPFDYGSTVSSETFTNREEDANRLSTNLLSGINTMLISPRRWGKSSLVEKVSKDMLKKEKKLAIVNLDLFSVKDEAGFLQLFAREVIKASSSKWEDRLQTAKTIFKQLIPKLSVSVDPNSDISLSFDWNELERHSDEILNLPETIAEKKSIRFIVCIDEFQQLAMVSGYSHLEKKMRAAWQRHKKVTYCLYGSKRHMMEEIFNNPSKPFYRFGDVMMLKKIAQEKWVSFICERFASTGKSIAPEDARSIAALMQNHSWYVQQLAHYSWNYTKKVARAKEVESALEELLRTNSPFFQREIELMAMGQLNLLKVIAAGETMLTSQRVMKEFRLGTPRSIIKNKETLMKHDIIERSENKYVFLDPVFEIWFRRLIH